MCGNMLPLHMLMSMHTPCTELLLLFCKGCLLQPIAEGTAFETGFKPCAWLQHTCAHVYAPKGNVQCSSRHLVQGVQSKRLTQNRIAARKSRQKRKDYVEDLREQVTPQHMQTQPATLRCVILVAQHLNNAAKACACHPAIPLCA